MRTIVSLRIAIFGTLLLCSPAIGKNVPACPAVKGQPLTAVRVFSGPPAELADLRSDSGGKHGKIEYESYGSLDLDAGHGTWLQCFYGHERVEVSIGRTAKRCTARYERMQKGQPVLRSFTCAG